MAISGNLRVNIVNISLIIILSVCILFGQNITDIIEDDINLPEQTLIQETLNELANNPLDLNTARYEDFIKISYLTPVLVNRILKARKDKSGFRILSDLIEIPGIDNELLQKIKPYVTIKSQTGKITNSLRSRINIDTLSNISKTEQWEISGRNNFLSTYQNTNLRIVILTDKDANEKKLADFFSTSVSITSKSSKVILGDYLLNFGSGLIFTGPYSYINQVKNFTLTPLKSTNELTGVYENSSLFGITFSQIISNFNICSYLSSSHLDAEIKNGTVKKVYYYTKYNDSLSIVRKSQLRENLIGTRLTYTPAQSLIIGTSFYYNNYDKQFAPAESISSFYGKNLNLIGLDVQTIHGNYFLKTEVGYSISNGFGVASQIIGDWQFLKVNLNIYAQQKKFFSPHSKWRTLSNRKDNISSSFNMSYNIFGFKLYFLASTKQDFTTDSLPARIQYRIDRKQGPYQFGISLKGNYKEAVLNTYGTRLDFSYQISNHFNLSARFEDCYLKTSPHYGRLLFIGGKYRAKLLTIESRLYNFSITSSDCKIYCYETSGSYGFNNKGIRIYNSLSADICKLIKINYCIGYTNSLSKNLNSALSVTADL